MKPVKTETFSKTSWLEKHVKLRTGGQKMTREELSELGITDAETVNKIMALNSKAIDKVKEKFADYDSTKEALKKAQETIEGFGDVEAIKADVEKYKTEAKLAKENAEKEINNLKLSATVKDFTGSKKFVNDITRDAINAQLLAAMQSEDAKGKSIDDLFKGIVEGKENVLVDENAPKPPVQTSMTDNGKPAMSGLEAAFYNMNPQIKH